ncbi:chaperone modulator CbpM [Flavobacterium sp. HNIBRBA15423]|uniref:chaperone modulator CbpM n=1 Tax=Flavobacterium sp. HNIBRBA15423 TaxID=3458683 RepID=UPI004044033B
MNTEELIIVDLFCQECEIEITQIQDLEAFGLIETVQYNENKYFNKNQLAEIERILRLHNELHINKEGIDVILHLTEKLNQLQSEVRYLKNRLDLYE